MSESGLCPSSLDWGLLEVNLGVLGAVGDFLLLNEVENGGKPFRNAR